MLQSSQGRKATLVVCSHKRKGIEKYPAEIIKLPRLEEAIGLLDSMIIDVRGTHIDRNAYDAQVWADVLTATKRGMTGDEALLLSYAKQVDKYPKMWKAAIVEELESIGKDETFAFSKNLELATLRKLEPDAFMKKVQESCWEGVS